MNNPPEIVEARLREYYHGSNLSVAEPVATDTEKSIEPIVNRARLHTGSRDLVLLAVTSFLAILLAIAPSLTGPHNPARKPPSKNTAEK